MNFGKESLLLYAVTDAAWVGTSSLVAQVAEALQGGVTLVQLRAKELKYAQFLAQATALTTLCHQYQVPLLINDNVEIALASGADGVHLGQEDLPAGEARKRLGANRILGVTAHTVAEATAAAAAGADYLGVGAVFATRTKKNTIPLSRETLLAMRAAVSLPMVAIGGITKENLPALAGSGVSGVALVSAIFAAKNIREECVALRRLSQKMVGAGGTP